MSQLAICVHISLFSGVISTELSEASQLINIDFFVPNLDKNCSAKLVADPDARSVSVTFDLRKSQTQSNLASKLGGRSEAKQLKSKQGDATEEPSVPLQYLMRESHAGILRKTLLLPPEFLVNFDVRPTTIMRPNCLTLQFQKLSFASTQQSSQPVQLSLPSRSQSEPVSCSPASACSTPSVSRPSLRDRRKTRASLSLKLPVRSTSGLNAAAETSAATTLLAVDAAPAALSIPAPSTPRSARSDRRNSHAKRRQSVFGSSEKSTSLPASPIKEKERKDISPLSPLPEDLPPPPAAPTAAVKLPQLGSLGVFCLFVPSPQPACRVAQCRALTNSTACPQATLLEPQD